MQAIHGGTAQNDTSAAHTSAVLRRGGLLPPACVYPAAMRATRALLRRRRHLMRKRAERLTHRQQTTRQDTLPELGKTLADNAHRAGVAERFAEPAGHKSLAVDLALMRHDDALLRDMAVSVLTTAKAHPTNTRYVLRTVPGSGERLRLVLRDESHDSHRFPRVQEFVSSCRLVTCAKESAGNRSGTGGPKLGHADLTWAFSDAAVRFVRAHPSGQQDLTRLEQTPGQGKALTVLAHPVARAVYDRLTRATAFNMAPFIHGERRGASEPDASLDRDGMRLNRARCNHGLPASVNANAHVGRIP
jgi:transposase